MSVIKFGTDGWGALMDKDFTFQNVELVAQGFADFLNGDFKKRSLTRRPKVVIGYDTRENSDNFSKIFAEVLNGNEIDVLLSDRACPTPAVSFTIVNRKCDAGI